MKQRITYLVPHAEDFNPELLNVKESSLSLRNVKAAKEHRITLGVEELPRELRKYFDQWHELHIRWASETPYPDVAPFTSRVSPGLHVFFTPRKDRPEEDICPVIKDFFSRDLKCHSTTSSFTKLPLNSEHSSRSPSPPLQYYSYLPTLSDFVFMLKKMCPPSSTACKDAAASLRSASYVDVDYNAISHSVVFNAFWAQAPVGGSWTESIFLPGTQETIEIGVLNHEPNPDPEDIAFAGFLTVLGQDIKPKPTRFQTPTRHYPLPKSAKSKSKSKPLAFKTSFSKPTGMHPTLLISLPRASLSPPDSTCKLHTHLTLPSTLFLDKYAFSDPLFLSSHNLVALRSISGATDLEAPDWVVPEWGSAALFELAVPPTAEQHAEGKEDAKGTTIKDTSSNQDDWEISIPMHLRYLPAANSSHASVPVPWPVLFWACDSEQEASLMNNNPFDRRHLGYEALFDSATRFIHTPPSPQGNESAIAGDGRIQGAAVSYIDVPILDLRSAGWWVEGGTVGVVVAAFFWLCWMLFKPQSPRQSGTAEAKSQKKKKKQ